MTPITQTRKLHGGGLEDLAALVLKPYFHSDGPPKKVSNSLFGAKKHIVFYVPNGRGERVANKLFTLAHSTQFALLLGRTKSLIGIESST